MAEAACALPAFSTGIVGAVQNGCMYVLIGGFNSGDVMMWYALQAGHKGVSNSANHALFSVV